MKNEYKQLYFFEDNRLLISFILSSLTHIFLLIGIPIENNKLSGDKYVPVQIIDLTTSATLGESITKSQNIENSLESNLEKQLEDNNEEKEDEFKEEDLQENLIKKLSVDKENNNSSLIKNINKKSEESNEKVFGIKKGLEKENIESGSIKGTGIQKITCLKCLEPKYPKLAIKRGYEGTLKLEITILKNGLVKDVLIKESTGYNILDISGIYAAKNSKFYPLTRETKLDIEYKLELN
tara:strand:+ start:14777 stop:15490 length:714 start_codon:yes stop_codon:yes gene_type:complete